MIRMLHGISRLACPPADRRWVDALFAESAQIEGARERMLWLLGAVGLVVSGNATRIAGAVSPSSMVLLLATAVFALLAVVEYEGFAVEDDWYGAIAAGLGACFLAVVARKAKRSTREPRL